jgi:hypothetical protein
VKQEHLSSQWFLVGLGATSEAGTPEFTMVLVGLGATSEAGTPEFTMVFGRVGCH